MKNHLISVKSKADREGQDETSLRKRAAQDAVGDADSYATSVRRDFEKIVTQNSGEPSTSSLFRDNTRAKVGLEEDVDGVLIHSVEGATRLILSDEILQISNLSESESIRVGPIRLFHVQSRSPWMQLVRPGVS